MIIHQNTLFVRRIISLALSINLCLTNNPDELVGIVRSIHNYMIGFVKKGITSLNPSCDGLLILSTLLGILY